MEYQWPYHFWPTCQHGCHLIELPAKFEYYSYRYYKLGEEAGCLRRNIVVKLVQGRYEKFVPWGQIKNKKKYF